MTATICHNRQWKFLIYFDFISSVANALAKTYTDPFHNEMSAEKKIN